MVPKQAKQGEATQAADIYGPGAIFRELAQDARVPDEPESWRTRRTSPRISVLRHCGRQVRIWIWCPGGLPPRVLPRPSPAPGPARTTPPLQPPGRTYGPGSHCHGIRIRGSNTRTTTGFPTAATSTQRAADIPALESRVHQLTGRFLRAAADAERGAGVVIAACPQMRPRPAGRRGRGLRKVTTCPFPF